ncbi:MAG: hypothetical protein WBN75_14495 [Verrucomicrobiia bacterium]
MSTAPLEHGYERNAGWIYVPGQPVCHRDEEYDQAGFDILCDMQSRHFWYQGRHRFLLRALKDQPGAICRAGRMVCAPSTWEAGAAVGSVI